jgi:hypothetical protein
MAQDGHQPQADLVVEDEAIINNYRLNYEKTATKSLFFI